MSVFFASDTHFMHKNIIKFEKEYRPFNTIEEHDEELIKRWNSVVGHADIVWHLGDVLFSGHAFALLDRLNGRKNLVMGNHDTNYPIARYLEKFRKVVGVASFDQCILSHVPIHTNQFYRFRANIHGHTHSKVVQIEDSPDERYACVSMEQINLTPIAYEELNKRLPPRMEK